MPNDSSPVADGLRPDEQVVRVRLDHPSERGVGRTRPASTTPNTNDNSTEDHPVLTQAVPNPARHPQVRWRSTIAGDVSDKFEDKGNFNFLTMAMEKQLLDAADTKAAE